MVPFANYRIWIGKAGEAAGKQLIGLKVHKIENFLASILKFVLFLR